jgi:hypothetical protein
MRATPLAIAGAALFVCFATSAAADSNCVSYDETAHASSRSLDMHLANGCARSMACAVKWTVKCGKTSRAGSASAVLASLAERTFVATAGECDDDWVIETNWSCNPGR